MIQIFELTKAKPNDSPAEKKLFPLINLIKNNLLSGMIIALTENKKY